MMVKLNFNPYYNSICFNKECVIRTLYFLSDMLKNNLVHKFVDHKLVYQD